jgi:hypothetical protein
MGVILMDFFGLDLAGILFTAAFVSFWGAILVGFFVFYDKNPYVPRRYYRVKLKNKDGSFLRFCKGWIVNVKKVKWFRVQLRGAISFKGVEKDIAIMETMDDEGIINIIENVPDKYEADNYTPETIPLTQVERFEKEVVNDVIMPLCMRSVEENGEVKNYVDTGVVEHYSLKVKESLNRNRRLVDLNTSKATKEYISQARREAERVKGDDFIYKYGPILSLIIACLFAYLIIDGSVKSYQTTMAQQAAVMEHGYSQVISQCGGVYAPINPPNNATAAPVKTGVQIPFITT